MFEALIGFASGVALGAIGTLYLQVRRTTRGRYFSI